jgi:hypothetical protein
MDANDALLLRFTSCALKMRHCFQWEDITRYRVFPPFSFARSHPGLFRTPILCSHFPHGNEHVMTCLARLFLASCIALELIQDPRHSLLSPSRNRNSAAQVVAAGLFQFSASWSWSMHLLPQLSASIKSLWTPALADCLMLCLPDETKRHKDMSA